MTPRVIRSSADAVDDSEVVVASSLARAAGRPLDPPHRIVPDVFQQPVRGLGMLG